jgi:acetylornithine deacetylase
MTDTRITEVQRWMKSEHDRILHFARALIETPTFNTPPGGQELAGQQLMREALSEIGWQTVLYSPEDAPGFRQHPAYWPGRNYTGRPNLLASRGRNVEDERRRLLFSGHMDVIPAGYAPSPEGQWDLPAHLATRYEDGRLYGPGAADMKGGLVAMWAAARCLTDMGAEPACQVLFESVVDEEYGGANGSLAGRLRGPQAGMAILPEPTNLEICPAALCGANYIVALSLKPGNLAGTVPGVDQNPAFWLAEFAQRLRDYDAWRTANRETPRLYADKPRPGLSISWMSAGAPPPAGLDRVPEVCSLAFGIEDYPEVTSAQLLNEIQERAINPLQARCPALEIDMRPGTRFLEGVDAFCNPADLRRVQGLARLATGKPPVVSGMAASCDVFMFSHYSATPALIYGPRGFGIHTQGEYVEFASVLELAQAFAALMLYWEPGDQ